MKIGDWLETHGTTKKDLVYNDRHCWNWAKQGALVVPVGRKRKKHAHKFREIVIKQVCFSVNINVKWPRFSLAVLVRPTEQELDRLRNVTDNELLKMYEDGKVYWKKSFPDWDEVFYKSPFDM